VNRSCAIKWEQLTVLDEMARFVKIISKAEDEYMPSGPPMSPLTTSFFTCWARIVPDNPLAFPPLHMDVQVPRSTWNVRERPLRR